MLNTTYYNFNRKRKTNVRNYFFFIGEKIVLTNGFVKKSQKTPRAEKELAKKYKADYERRYSDEQL
jgi:phage-related protein